MTYDRTPGRRTHIATTHKIADSPLGKLTLVAEDGALTGLYFPGHWHPPDPASVGARVEAGFERVERELGEYFAGERTRFELPRSARGDDFQRRVWELIDGIAYGQTRTYGELAEELGDPMLARDVGAAVGRNPLSLVVPCHRVVGAGGKLTGYAGGLERKRFLLELEGAAVVAPEPAGRLF